MPQADCDLGQVSLLFDQLSNANKSSSYPRVVLQRVKFPSTQSLAQGLATTISALVAANSSPAK